MSYINLTIEEYMTVVKLKARKPMLIEYYYNDIGKLKYKISNVGNNFYDFDTWADTAFEAWQIAYKFLYE